MKFRAAALAAWLAITAGGSALETMQTTQSTQEAADGVRLLLVRLERIVQGSDLDAYSALLTESADRDRMARFVDAELIPGMTRVVIQERDRLALAGTLPGDGYSVAVDVLEEYGDRARIATWWFDLKRDGPAGTDTEWRIADQGRLSSVEDLYRLSLDPAKQYVATNLEFTDEDLKLTLVEGSVFVSQIDQGTTALVLIGRGEMVFSPTPDTEKSQVRIFSGADAIETRFDAAYVRLNPGDFERLLSTTELAARPVDPEEFKRADKIFREDSQKAYNLELGDLSRDAWSIVPNARDFVAEVHTQRFKTLTYSRSSSLREDINLFDRTRGKTIAIYSSQLNDLRDLPTSGDDVGEFEVRHYDIDVTATPDRRWIEGSARMTVRAGARPIHSLTMRLAEPLVVESVMSQEYGRLFSMRVKDQNSVVISLPATLLPGAEITLTVNYAGRVEPQMLDAEALAVGQEQDDAPPPPRSDTFTAVDQVEPSLLYSSQISWYPRPSASHYATATLRITVPSNLACVASGERDAKSPVVVPARGSTPARKTYVFNAVQPLRYFAFLVTRLAAVRSAPVVFPPSTAAAGERPAGTLYNELKVSVEANPGHASRGREAADRAVDIARFYQSLLDDSPYPSLTVALVENALPGGHSPGYFSVVNQPAPPLPYFASRNDPASFEQFPDFFLAHEMAHQWWGQAVGWRSYHDQWISEGFAQYFAALYAQQRGSGGPDVFRGVMRQMRKWATDQTNAGPISLGYRLGHIQGDSKIFRALVYNKSAVVLHMLRRLVGDDVFFRGLRRFYRTSRFRSVRTADFKIAMEAEAGRPLGRFFDGWIYSSALPRLAFSYRIDGDAVVLHVDQTGEVFEVPVMVTLQYADRTSADVLVKVTERAVDLRVPLKGALRTAEISKDDPPLAELVKN